MVLSGLSILGNDETPKELVIVPWKSSQLADAPGISRLLDDSTQPVDKDVFMRELEYYGLKSADPERRLSRRFNQFFPQIPNEFSVRAMT